MADALSKRIRRAPPIVKTLIRWVTNPIILGGALFILTFFFLLERVHKAKWQNKAQESIVEFSRYRYCHSKRFHQATCCVGMTCK